MACCLGNFISLAYLQQDKKKKKKGVGSKKKAAAAVETRVVVARIQRQKRKFITVVSGLDTVPGKCHGMSPELSRTVQHKQCLPSCPPLLLFSILAFYCSCPCPIPYSQT